MEFNNPNFVSFMQTNYNTIRVSFLAANPMGPHPGRPQAPAPAMPAPVMAPLAPAWSSQDRPWATPEDSRPPEPQVQTYSYKVPKDMKLEVGDIVVVPSRDHIAFARVEVVDTMPSLDFSSGDVYKWVIQRVDFTAYNELIKAEAEFSRRMVEVQRMKKQQEMVRTMRDQFLSESDPETARLFGEALKSIGAQVPAAPIDIESK